MSKPLSPHRKPCHATPRGDRNTSTSASSSSFTATSSCTTCCCCCHLPRHGGTGGSSRGGGMGTMLSAMGSRASSRPVSHAHNGCGCRRASVNPCVVVNPDRRRHWSAFNREKNGVKNESREDKVGELFCNGGGAKGILEKAFLSPGPRT